MTLNQKDPLLFGGIFFYTYLPPTDKV